MTWLRARGVSILCLSGIFLLLLNGCSTRMGVVYLRGDAAVKEYYENREGDVGNVIVFGKTPLHVAATEGWQSAAELLVKKGAKIDARDDWGATPLHYALVNFGTNLPSADYQRQKRAIARMLITKGAGETKRSSGNPTKPRRN